MTEWVIAVSIGAVILATIIGYFFGYYHGRVAGELDAVKSYMRHGSTRRHHTRRDMSSSVHEAALQ
jgi:hypothetical protein